ncbi:alginate lyase family protein [Micromonospora endolithica]|uniref:alginate lyase family protein n=1 Tax=Micromonospora endolithica TaxID=230091 RepID=UPI00192DE58A|nr:alginate lyase family protein [Micromonospora endolithica]
MRVRIRGGLAVLVAAVVLIVSAACRATTSSAVPAGETAGVWAPEIPTGLPPVGTLRDARSGFVHPGVLVSGTQLDFVIGKVQAGEEPWLSAWLALRRSRYADLGWHPEPIAVVECGYYSQPDRGCTREAEDAVAAYTHALLWVFTRDTRYAEKAVQILDAWAQVLRRHANSNAQLQAGWSGATFVRAAELIKHTYPQWSPARSARAERMFRNVFLPQVTSSLKGYKAGNWGLIMLDAVVGISVFLDDRASFFQALDVWRLRMRAYVYVAADGPTPHVPPDGAFTKQRLVEYWGGQTRLVDGMAQETCRDLLHTGWGLAAAAHVAETAWIQGVDLYAEARKRLIPALEFHADFEMGAPVPPWLCGGQLQTGLDPLPEIAYNHYRVRMGFDLPVTRELVESRRPAGPAFFYAWETLTHAANPR